MPLPYIAQTLRQQDHDLYLLSLCHGAKVQSALQALFLLKCEIAKTRFVVSETQIGLIRLQWWRDRMAEIVDGQPPKDHPMIIALADIIKDYDLSQDLFDQMMYAHEFDLEGVAPATFDGAMTYCDATMTPLLTMMQIITGEKPDEEAARSVSRYFGFIRMVRSVPAHLSQGHVMLPQDIMTSRGIHAKKILDFDKRAEVRQVIIDCFDQYEAQPKPQPSSLRAFYHWARLIHRQLERAQYDVFSPTVALPPKFLALRLLLGI